MPKGKGNKTQAIATAKFAEGAEFVVDVAVVPEGGSFNPA